MRFIPEILCRQGKIKPANPCVTVSCYTILCLSPTLSSEMTTHTIEKKKIKIITAEECIIYKFMGNILLKSIIQ